MYNSIQLVMKYLLMFICLGNESLVMAQAKYELKISMDEIRCIKAVEGPFDTNEDIAGASWIHYYQNRQTNHRVGPYRDNFNCLFRKRPLHVLFSTEALNTTDQTVFKIEQGNLVDLAEFSVPMIIPDLLYDDLFNLVIYVGGDFFDEDFSNAHYTYCKQCLKASEDFMIDMRKYRNSLNIARIGQSDSLEILIDWYENKNSDSSRIRIKYSVIATRTQ